MKYFLDITDENGKEIPHDKITIESKYYSVVVHEEREGIIIDVWGAVDLINTATYWNNDQIESFMDKVQRLYQREGQSAVMKLGELLDLPVAECQPCETTVPVYDNHCLICSTEINEM